MSAPVILARTFSSVVDNRAKLANGNIARLWSSAVGTSWSVIRVGIRLSIEDSGANIISTPRFAFGICSGTSNIFMDATTTHFFGAVSNGATWQRRTTGTGYSDNSYGVGGNPGYTNNGYCVAKRIGSTLTVGSGFIGGDYCRIGWNTTPFRTVQFLEITKGSPNFSIKLFAQNTGAGTGVDQSLASFLSNMELTSPSITNYAFSGTQTMAIDEGTNGSFNAVNVAWDRNSPSIEISDVAVVKFS